MKLSTINEANAISRRDFVEVVRWLQSTQLNLGSSIGHRDYQRTSNLPTDITARVHDVGKWGVNAIANILSHIGGDNYGEMMKKIAAGGLDDKIVDVISTAIAVIDYLKKQLAKVKFDITKVASLEGLDKILDKYKSFISWRPLAQ